jgi:phosphoenolpyruvate carboxykinase (ATP)
LRFQKLPRIFRGNFNVLIVINKERVMNELGVHNPANGVAELGLGEASRVFYNLNESELYEEAIRNGEAELTIDGALRAVTGQHTGRSPKDKFVVRDASTENTIWWDNNKPLSPENFELLRQDMLAHAAGKTLYVQDLIGGADEENALPTRVVTELAWHSLFIRNLLIRPKRESTCRASRPIRPVTVCVRKPSSPAI